MTSRPWAPSPSTLPQVEAVREQYEQKFLAHQETLAAPLSPPPGAGSSSPSRHGGSGPRACWRKLYDGLAVKNVMTGQRHFSASRFKARSKPPLPPLSRRGPGSGKAGQLCRAYAYLACLTYRRAGACEGPDYWTPCFRRGGG